MKKAWCLAKPAHDGCPLLKPSLLVHRPLLLLLVLLLGFHLGFLLFRLLLPRPVLGWLRWLRWHGNKKWFTIYGRGSAERYVKIWFCGFDQFWWSMMRVGTAVCNLEYRSTYQHTCSNCVRGGSNTNTCFIYCWIYLGIQWPRRSIRMPRSIWCFLLIEHKKRRTLPTGTGCW